MEFYEDNISQKNVHSDAGEGSSIECPNCKQEVIFATSQWWRSTCECGEWELKQKAVLSLGKD